MEERVAAKNFMVNDDDDVGSLDDDERKELSESSRSLVCERLLSLLAFCDL